MQNTMRGMCFCSRTDADDNRSRKVQFPWPVRGPDGERIPPGGELLLDDTYIIFLYFVQCFCQFHSMAFRNSAMLKSGKKVHAIGIFFEYPFRGCREWHQIQQFSELHHSSDAHVIFSLLPYAIDSTPFIFDRGIPDASV